jgi:hypothetical protein
MIGRYRASCYRWTAVLVTSVALSALTPWMRGTIPDDRASAELLGAGAIAPSAVPVQVTSPAPAADLPNPDIVMVKPAEDRV